MARNGADTDRLRQTGTQMLHTGSRRFNEMMRSGRACADRLRFWMKRQMFCLWLGRSKEKGCLFSGNQNGMSDMGVTIQSMLPDLKEIHALLQGNGRSFLTETGRRIQARLWQRS